MSEQIILLDEPGDTGINEVAVSPITMPGKALPSATDRPAPVPEKKELKFRDSTVYARKSRLYIKRNGEEEDIATFAYEYENGYADEPAAFHEHNTKPIFFVNEEAKQAFLKIEPLISIIAGADIEAVAFFMGNLAQHCYANHDHVATVVFDGKALKYNQRHGEPNFMGLDSPIGQPAEEIFNSIMRFLTRSVKGVVNNIRQAKIELEHTASRKAEAIYHYLQDVTPAEDKVKLHEEILGLLENNYSGDAILLQQQNQEIAQLTSVVKGARSQMPTGKKGKSLRESYLQSPILPELLDWFTIHRNSDNLTLTFWFKQDLELEGYGGGEDDEDEHFVDYGRPVIEIQMHTKKENCRDGTYIRRVTGRSQDLRSFVHPHLDGTRSWCLGTYITPLNNAIVGGNIPMAASLLWQYIGAYNAESPLVGIDACDETMRFARKWDLRVRRK